MHKKIRPKVRKVLHSAWARFFEAGNFGQIWRRQIDIMITNYGIVVDSKLEQCLNEKYGHDQNVDDIVWQVRNFRLLFIYSACFVLIAIVTIIFELIVRKFKKMFKKRKRKKIRQEIKNRRELRRNSWRRSSFNHYQHQLIFALKINPV